MNIGKRILEFILCSALLVGCASAPAAEPENTLTLQDGLERTVEVPEKPQRVVSVMPSFTEIWLLAGGTVIGTVEDTKQRGIDTGDAVTVGSYHTPNLEEILALNPDFVILSADLEEHRTLVSSLEEAGIACVGLKEETLGDYLHLLDLFCELTDHAENYEKYGTKVQTNVDDIIETAEALDQHPTVLLLRAMSTKVAVLKSDNQTGLMLKNLGCINIAETDESLLNDLSMEKILMEDPDYIFVVPMGNEEAAEKMMKDTLENNPAWSTLKAVQQGHYEILPKDLFHYKPNERWAESYEYLGKILYPDVFPE